MTNPISNGHADASSPDLALLDKLKTVYSAAGQSHVFTFYDQLPAARQSALVAQLASIDVHRVNRIYTNAVAADAAVTPPQNVLQLDDSLVPGGRMIGRSRTPSPTPDQVLPLPEAACASIVSNPDEEARWRDIGLQAVADNEVAVLLLAGGQGTRLGSSHPKGMYDIHLPSGNNLFDIQAGRIKRLEAVAAARGGKPPGGVKIRWYVMTSGPTREETVNHFETRHFFGLRREDVVFFEQGRSS